MYSGNNQPTAAAAFADGNGRAKPVTASSSSSSGGNAISLPKPGGRDPSIRQGDPDFPQQRAKPVNNYSQKGARGGGGGGGRAGGSGQQQGLSKFWEVDDNYGQVNHPSGKNPVGQASRDYGGKQRSNALDGDGSDSIRRLARDTMGAGAQKRRVEEEEKQKKAERNKALLHNPKRKDEDREARLAATTTSQPPSELKSSTFYSKPPKTSKPPPKQKNRMVILDEDDDDNEGRISTDDESKGTDLTDYEEDNVAKEARKKRKLQSSVHTVNGRERISSKSETKSKKKRNSSEIDLTQEDDSPQKPLSKMQILEQAAKLKMIKDRKRGRKERLRKENSEEDDDEEKEKEEVEISSSEDEETMQEKYKAMMEAERARVAAGGTPDPLLTLEEKAIDPKLLCPFCNALFPEEPSQKLIDLRDYLLEQPHIRDNPTLKNPLGKRLSVVETASFCRRHNEERDIIPKGKERGWPSEVDWDGLSRRIRKELNDHLMDVIQKKKESEFLNKAIDEWTTTGARKMGNIMSEWTSFDVEQPGYFGPRGYELFTDILQKSFIDVGILSNHLAAPLDISFYLRRVLIPEVAVELISRDLNVSRAEAMEIRAESASYGKALFGSSEEEEQFRKAEELREAKEMKAAEKAKEDAKRKKENEKREKDNERIKAETKARLQKNAPKGKKVVEIEETSEDDDDSDDEEGDDGEDKKMKDVSKGKGKAVTSKKGGGKKSKNESGSSVFSSDSEDEKKKKKKSSKGKGKVKEVKLSREEAILAARKEADLKSKPKLTSMNLDDSDSDD